MSSIAKTGISLSKKDLTKSRVPPVGSRNVVFYHKPAVSSLTISLLSLILPSSEMPNAVQATIEELAGARLTVNKKNLSLQSSTKGQLIQNLDYIVVDSMTINLIGPYASVGSEYDEIFVGTINCAAISDLVVASSKNVVRSYVLPVGQTTLNVAQEFKVNQYPSENIGIIKIFVNGVLAFRNTGNSSVSLDRDYREVDSGNGFGTVVIFNVAPTVTAHNIIVDFGVQSVTDFDAIGTIESLSGSVKKIADDLAVIAGTSTNDYMAANPSDVERRGFGDMVLDHEATLPLKADLNGSAANLFSVANATSASNAVAFNQLSKYAVLRDEKAAGTNAQTISTSWAARTLNTINDPSSIIVNASSFTGVGGANSQFTLSAGTYLINGSAPFGNVVAPYQSKARIYNVTDSTTALIGTTQYNRDNSGTPNIGISSVLGIITITSTKTFEFQHIASASGAAGLSWNVGVNEVYSMLSITKIA